jgi:DNA-binding NarL/FixJ family response regulator
MFNELSDEALNEHMAVLQRWINDIKRELRSREPEKPKKISNVNCRAELDARNLEIFRLVESGEQIAQVARAYNVTGSRISQIHKQYLGALKSPEC